MSSKWTRENLPFVWGAQYYRSPTPEPQYWRKDFELARAVGMTDMKFWVQWRVANPAEGEYWFDDIDALMDLAAETGMRATINVIYDVLPQWVLARHGDCLMITTDGRPVRPYASASRQTGGYPGPCLNHPGALEIRKDFTRAVVERYRAHPAMFMWDVWNEPEQCAPFRRPDVEKLTCYCPVCQGLFRKWLAARYGRIERLNEVWGRYYRSWDDVETPTAVDGLTDMVDWRLFMLATITRESAWRVELARRLDGDHAVYTHVVPTIAQKGWGFNQITCTDDFALGEQGDIFAGTVNRFPVMPVKVVSAAAGKVCYNVESHLNGGNTAYHPRPLTIDRLKKEFLVQIGQGVRGFMFWQFHAEAIGLESPAWGLVDTGGNPRLAYESTGNFHQAVGTHFDAIMQAPPPAPRVGIHLAAANEIFQWCIGLRDDFGVAVAGYVELLFWNSVPVSLVPSARVSDEGLAGLDVLVLPQAYCLAQPEVDAILRWVRAGGLLVAEAHTAGYSLTAGRHQAPLPGCGLAEAFGIREIEAWGGQAERKFRGKGAPAEHVQQDVLVAMGGKFRPDLQTMRLEGSEEITFGHKRCAGIGPGNAQVLARYLNGTPAVVLATVGKGSVLYAGSNFGPIVRSDASAVGRLIVEKISARAAPTADVEVIGQGAAHLDRLDLPDGRCMFILAGEGDKPCRAAWSAEAPLKGVFTGLTLAPKDGRVECDLTGDFADLFVPQASAS